MTPVNYEGDPKNLTGTFAHYAKLSRAMRAPWVDSFLNNEIYGYPLSKKLCGCDRGDRNLRPAAT